MPAEKIHLSNAKNDKLFYIVANVVVYRNGKCLILKRSENEKVHPGKYAVPGGKLEWNDLPLDSPTRMNGDVLDYEDAVEKLLIREVMEESGLEIDLSKGMKYINSVAFIRPDGIPVILVKFAAHCKDGNVILEEGSFTNHAWVDAEEIKNFECIKGIDEEIKTTLQFFNHN